ncbi:MAG TPA: TonB-dependent receptor [Puia sp.]|uniref:TonB-dependent receptor n=1 Tax=Puia sp. TaxID=2045100 RepID=UPI002CF652D3|nr:TonB-dependent receptor [Puia sp.]HVU94704.1 TonB-dependent receptor [Puia sp.]
MLLTVASVSVFGQTKGKVIDSKTGEPIAGATVKGIETVTTDTYGNFVVKAETEITVTHIGYETKTVQAGKSPLTVALFPSTAQLAEIRVSAFNSNRKLLDVAAPVTVLGERDLDKGDNFSIVPVLNSVPGVRLDYYTLNDYRINIRGSILGTYSVHGDGYKTYWNDIPFTPGSGGGVLGSIDVNALDNIEVIRGPGSSLYGAGIGGVLLLTTKKADHNENSVSFDGSIGSYGARRFTTSIKNATDKTNVFAQFTDIEYDGYRTGGFSNSKYVTLGAQFYHSEKSTSTLLAGYQIRRGGISGNLDSAAAAKNPRQASTLPPTGYGPQQYSIGYANKYRFDSKWSNTFSANLTDDFGATFVLVYPYFSIWEKYPSKDLFFRNTTTYNSMWGKTGVKITFGAEYTNTLDETKYFKGSFDSTITEDRRDITSAFIGFAQAELSFPHDWILTAGLSYNNYFYRLQSFIHPSDLERHADNVSPRISLLKKINDDVSVYGSYSRGFTAPQGGPLGDFFNADGTVNANLKATLGSNYEAGIKAASRNRKLYAEANVYQFNLTNAIVPVLVPVSGVSIAKNTNAGKIDEFGIESSAGYNFVMDGTGFIKMAGIKASYTYNHYIYKDYKTYVQVGYPPVNVDADYRNNEVPGAIPHTVTASADINTAPGFYASASYYSYSKQPLNNANDSYYKAFSLLNIKAGFRRRLGNRFEGNIYGGINNVGNTHYSGLIEYNEANRQYFNPAANVNYYGGISARLIL